jgi:hypothetical protein
MGCAVQDGPTLTNGTRQVPRIAGVRERTIASRASMGANVVPPEGLAPGVAKVTGLPDCMATRVLSVVFADGTRQGNRDTSTASGHAA